MSSQLSITAKKQCIEANGGKCPFCNVKLLPVFAESPSIITISDIAVYPRTLTRIRICDSDECRKGWKEIYKLSDIEEIPPSEKTST